MSKSKDINYIRRDIKNVLNNKYYNLWMSRYESDLEPEAYHYLMKEYYDKGTVSAFEKLGEVFFAPYTVQTYNMYDYPEVIQFVNIRNNPIIPKKAHIVNKNCAIGYCQSNHKSIKYIVDKYINKIVEVEMVINTNLITMKLPLMIAISPEDKDKAESIVKKILNDEPVIFCDLDDLNLVKTLVNGNQYIIDKLVEYKQQVECELLTFLGLDNAVSQKVNLDVTNANNSLINAFKEDIDMNIQNFVEDCKKYLGVDFYLEMRQPEVMSVYEEDNPELEDNTTKEGIVGDHE